MLMEFTSKKEHLKNGFLSEVNNPIPHISKGSCSTHVFLHTGPTFPRPCHHLPGTPGDWGIHEVGNTEHTQPDSNSSLAKTLSTIYQHLKDWKICLQPIFKIKSQFSLKMFPLHSGCGKKLGILKRPIYPEAMGLWTWRVVVAGVCWAPALGRVLCWEGRRCSVHGCGSHWLRPIK